MEVDANGIVQSGKFQGHHVDDVIKFAEDLQDAVAKGTNTPPSNPNPPNNPQPRDPNATLREHATNRTGALEQTLQNRLEQDDEAAFAAQVSDYEKYREKVAKMKEPLMPQARIAKGLHKMLYGLIKQQEDPVVQHHLYGTPLPQPKPEEQPPASDGQQPPAEPKQDDNKQATPAAGSDPLSQIKREPKPASPVAAPTAPNRDSQNQQRKPKLQANDKIKKMAAALGKPLDEYLLILEDQGTTQDTIDLSAVKRVPKQSQVFGRWGG